MRFRRFSACVVGKALGSLAAGLFLSSCAAELENPERFRGTSEVTVKAACDAPKTVLADRCVRCHSSREKGADLDLESPDLATRLVRVRASGGTGLLIDPSAIDQSVLFLKVKNPPFGARMPLGGVALTDAEANCVHEWITSVARDDVAPIAGGDAGGDAGDSGG